jgi:predicted nucleic acid-binding protein
VIVDASVIVDVVADELDRGTAARQVLSRISGSEPLVAPAHFAIELMSGLRAFAKRPGRRFSLDDVPRALLHAGTLGIEVEATPWADVSRAWELSGSLRFTDALYVAAAERHQTGLLTCDGRIARSGAPFMCPVLTVPMP